ncbi:MAG TPA: ATP-binding protein, partial [Polyangiales bacterium]
TEALRASGEPATRPREVELTRGDGTRAPVMLGVSSVEEDGARKIAFLFDLSERRRLEQQLLHAQRMEAVGRLAAGIAHDFNNVLSAITMGAELVGEALPAGHAREELRELRKAADRAVRLVRQLLTFSRQQVLEPRVLSLNELVANLEDMLRRVLGSQLALRSELAAQQPEVKADPGQIEQVILNLVVNARDAMPQGGLLTLRTENVWLESQRTFDVPLPPGPYVVLSVSDTGTGMDAATRARMFEPFFTTKEQGKGTGLGLSTVYGIVRQSGGAIDVVSAPGSGTTLSVYLPRVDEAAHPTLIPASPETSGGHETILIVEPDAVLRRTTRKLLVSLGYRLLDTDSVAAALALAKVYVGAIDLLLVDPGGPSQDRAAALAELRALRPKLRVLYTSSNASEGGDERALLAPGTRLLQSPFASAALARELRHLLDDELA